MAVDFSSDTHWIDDVREPNHFVKNQTKTVLVALQDEASTKETLSNVMSSLLVQYFASGNYGFVKLLSLNDLGSGNIVDCTLQLMEKATSVLNQVSFPGGRGGGRLPYKWLMGVCRWMGSHFHDWID